jgi:hypothetical protein
MDSVINVLSSALAVGSAAFLLYAVIRMTLIIRKNSDSLESPEFEAKFGTLTKGLWTKSTIGRYWTVITLVRWATLCVIVVGLSDFPQF